MKENERLSNKLNSIFWFVLTTLPLIILLIVFIFVLPQNAKSYDFANNNISDFIGDSFDNSSFYENIFNQFNNFSIPYTYDTFESIFTNTFDISNSTPIVYLFGWMLSVQVYHLIYDVLKFIIGWCHHLIEKAYF